MEVNVVVVVFILGRTVYRNLHIITQTVSTRRNDIETKSFRVIVVCYPIKYFNYKTFKLKMINTNYNIISERSFESANNFFLRLNNQQV
jgi:hypothetical protein